MKRFKPTINNLGLTTNKWNWRYKREDSKPCKTFTCSTNADKWLNFKTELFQRPTVTHALETVILTKGEKDLKIF